MIANSVWQVHATKTREHCLHAMHSCKAHVGDNNCAADRTLVYEDRMLYFAETILLKYSLSPQLNVFVSV
jgi:hypothetical protein